MSARQLCKAALRAIGRHSNRRVCHHTGKPTFLACLPCVLSPHSTWAAQELVMPMERALAQGHVRASPGSHELSSAPWFMRHFEHPPSISERRTHCSCVYWYAALPNFRGGRCTVGSNDQIHERASPRYNVWKELQRQGAGRSLYLEWKRRKLELEKFPKVRTKLPKVTNRTKIVPLLFSSRRNVFESTYLCTLWSSTS